VATYTFTLDTHEVVTLGVMLSIAVSVDNKDFRNMVLGTKVLDEIPDSVCVSLRNKIISALRVAEKELGPEVDMHTFFAGR
jgi:hypothetical protein